MGCGDAADFLVVRNDAREAEVRAFGAGENDGDGVFPEGFEFLDGSAIEDESIAAPVLVDLDGLHLAIGIVFGDEAPGLVFADEIDNAGEGWRADGGPTGEADAYDGPALGGHGFRGWGGYKRAV